MKMLLTILTLFISLELHAPDYRVCYVSDGEKINPYIGIMRAVGMVESRIDFGAYNKIEGATGWLQVRQVRLDDYYRRTGVRYQLVEMYDSAKSVNVFLYYARLHGFREPEVIARKWNGGEERGMRLKQTANYWQKVKTYL